MNDARKFGRHLKLLIRGASHARCIRFELENFPAGFKVDLQALTAFMERRAPGRNSLSTQRRERDAVGFVRGLAEGTTTGETLIGEIVNEDMRPADYGQERTIPRPGHADFGQWVQTGRIPTGGGKNSGRMTVALCAAGAVCKQWLEHRGISVQAQVEAIGGKTTGLDGVVRRAQRDGDSVGGTIRCMVTGMPPGVGGALFEGVESELSAALFAIPGVKGIEFGAGFDAAKSRGSEYNDSLAMCNGEVVSLTNRQGGLLGGRTSVAPIEFRLALRPTPTIFKPQASVDLSTMEDAVCTMKGRHDPCIVLRAVPVAEAVTALVLADILLEDEASHPRICLTLTGHTLAENRKQYQDQRYFTDMVEVRADLLSKGDRDQAAGFPSELPPGVPTLLTLRRKVDGGDFVGSERTRVAYFRKLLMGSVAAGRKFDYVDFESDFRVPALEALAERLGIVIVRSLHSFAGPVRNLPAALRRLVGNRREIAKIAFMPHDLGDVSKAFKELAADKQLPPHVVCAMGPQGVATRVLAGRLGSCWTYASVGGLESLGQLSPHELVRDYRLRTLSSSAKLYGVTGWPLVRTRSPELHNAAFAAEDADALMIPMPAKTAREAMEFMVAMDMQGLAVTIPHKLAIGPLLDRVDAAARSVGAVNTVFLKHGRRIGSNTDVSGFAEAIVAFAGELSGKRVALLGNGGAALAVRTALRKLGAKVKVFHRTTPAAGFDLIVNATPVDPILDYVFSGRELVYDLRYVPECTSLMTRAASAGCKVENGFGMLQAQARGQRRLWTR